MSKPSDVTILAWTRLVRAHAVAMGSVQTALKAADLPPLEWYDVLLELERGRPMRPRDLQAKLLLAQYNLSRLLDRMRETGLVASMPCEDDKRGQLLEITDEGRALRRQMWPVYAAAVERSVGLKLSDGEATTLADLLARLTVAEMPHLF